ncbi:hypothetical protein ACJX0J_022750 [Zea mays]
MRRGGGGLLFAQQLYYYFTLLPLIYKFIWINLTLHRICMFCCRWHDSLNTTRIGPSGLIPFSPKWKNVFLSMSDLVAFVSELEIFVEPCDFVCHVVPATSAY